MLSLSLNGNGSKYKEVRLVAHGMLQCTNLLYFLSLYALSATLLIYGKNSIEKNGIVKTYKVKENYGFTYAIRKTFIGCENINNLINHFKECIENDFAVKVWCIDPINQILEKTKPISNL